MMRERPRVETVRTLPSARGLRLETAPLAAGLAAFFLFIVRLNGPFLLVFSASSSAWQAERRRIGP